MTELVSFLPLVAIALLFWLMVVRPASRRQKELARLQSSLEPGQRVMLSSGIFGTVTSVADDRVRVEIAPGVEVEVVRPAIGSVETVEEVAEPFLVRSGLLARTPRGRVATRAAWHHLGLSMPAGAGIEGSLFDDV